MIVINHVNSLTILVLISEYPFIEFTFISIIFFCNILLLGIYLWDLINLLFDYYINLGHEMALGVPRRGNR